MGEDALRESLTTSVGTEILIETEGLSDRQVGLDVHHRSTDLIDFLEDLTTSLGEDVVDTTRLSSRNLDFAEVDGLNERRRTSEDTSTDDTTSRRHDLTHTSVDGIGVEGGIEKLGIEVSARLISHGTSGHGETETVDDGFLDFVKVGNTVGGINENVGTIAIGSEGPDLTELFDIHAVVGSELTSTLSLILVRIDFLGIDLLSKTIGKRLGGHVKSVVLVGGLGKTLLRELSDGLSEGDDGRRDLDGSTLHEIILKILEANLEVELTGTGNNVLTRLGVLNDDHGIGLGESLKTFDETRKITRVLGLDGDTDDGGDGELHHLEDVGALAIGDGSLLEDVLIDTDEGGGVTARNIGDLLDSSTHHNDSTLNSLDSAVVLGAGDVVGSENSDLLTGGDLTGEDTTEGVETGLIGGGDHLGDVEHKRTVGIAVLHGSAALIILGTVVKEGSTVLLGSDGGRKVDDNHLKASIGSGEPLLHDSLKEGLLNPILLLTDELDTDLVEHLHVLVGLLLEDSVEKGVDGLEAELDEGSLEGLLAGGLALLLLAVVDPLLVISIVEVVTPELLHHLVVGGTELLGVHTGELGESESPLLETRTEGDSTLGRTDLDVTNSIIVVGGDDDVDGFDGLVELQVSLFGVELKLKNDTIELVAHEDGANSLTKSLTKDSLGLDADATDGIDDDQGTIGDTKGGGDFRGEIDVTGGIDKVDQVGVLGNLDVVLDGGLTFSGLTLFQVLALGNSLFLLEKSIGVVLEVKRNTSRLNSNTSLLLIGTGIGETSITSGLLGNNTGLGDEAIGKSGLAVIDVGNDG